MESRLMHSMLPRVLVAAMFCLVALNFWDFCQRGSLCLAADQTPTTQPVAEITVRSNVVVNEKRLKLVDFCASDALPEEWKMLLAEVDLGPAPETGRDTTFSPQRLLRHLQHLIAAQGIDPQQTKIHLPDNVTVARQQIQITREQIEELFKEFVLKKAPWKPEDLAIGQICFTSLPVLPSGHLSYEATGSPQEHFLGDVSVTIHFYIDNREVRNMRVSGKVDLYQEVVHSARSMKRNEVISDADIQLVRANIAARPERYLLQRDQVVGKRLLHDIGPNQPLSPRDLDQPPLVKRGDAVTMIFQLEGIRLSAKGEAKENGGQGGRIRIKNADSNKTVLCQIIDSQTVEVLP